MQRGIFPIFLLFGAIFVNFLFDRKVDAANVIPAAYQKQLQDENAPQEIEAKRMAWGIPPMFVGEDDEYGENFEKWNEIDEKKRKNSNEKID